MSDFTATSVSRIELTAVGRGDDVTPGGFGNNFARNFGH